MRGPERIWITQDGQQARPQVPGPHARPSHAYIPGGTKNVPIKSDKERRLLPALSRNSHVIHDPEDPNSNFVQLKPWLEPLS